MKLRIFSAAGLVAAALGLGSAFAGPFDGGYIGISVGDAMSGKARLSAGANNGAFGTFFPQTAAGGSFQQSYSGVAYGAHIGFGHVYSAPMGNILLGLEVGGGSGSLSSTSTNPMGALTVGAVAVYKTKVRWVATVTPRIGFVWGNNALYAKGGLAIGGVDSNLSSTGGLNGTRNFNEKANHVGHTLGVGWENTGWFGPSWIIGIAYDRIDLGTRHYGGDVTPTVSGWPLSYTVKTKYNEVSLRLSHRF